jgi:hypothetical protein
LVHSSFFILFVHYLSGLFIIFLGGKMTAVFGMTLQKAILMGQIKCNFQGNETFLCFENKNKIQQVLRLVMAGLLRSIAWLRTRRFLE